VVVECRRWCVVMAATFVLAACPEKFEITGPDAGSDATVTPDTAGEVETTTEPDVCNPIAWAWGCLLPYPSNVFTEADASTATGLRVTIPEKALPRIGGEFPFNPLGLFPADGFPMGTPLVAVFPSGVDPAVLTRHFDAPERSLEPTQTTTLVLRASDGEPVLHFAELDVNSEDATRQALVLRPMQALAPNTRYIVAMRGLVTPSGSATLAPTSFQELRSGAAATGGDARLAALQEHYDASIFPVLETAGWPRSEVQLAWDFTVGTESGDRSAAMAVAEGWLSAEGAPAVTVDAVQADPSADIALRIDAHFDMVNVLDGTDATWGALLQRDASGAVAGNGVRRVDVVIAVPNSVASLGTGAAQVPVLVMGHEFFGEAQEVVGPVYAATLEALQAVGVATNWIGMDTDAVTDILTDIQNEPEAGLRFTDRVHQALVNFRGLRAVIEGPLAEIAELQRDGAPIYDPTAVHFYGAGQGHILGASLLGLDSGFASGVLVGGAGGFSTIFSRARNFSLFINILRGKVDTELELQKLLALSMFAMERIDSLKVQPWAMSVLMQHAIGSSESPIMATRAQARSMGVPLLSPVVESVVGLTEATAPLSAPAAALAEYSFNVDPAPGVEMVLPDENNGVHDQIQNHPAALDQVRQLLQTGTIQHTCDGPCDPD